MNALLFSARAALITLLACACVQDSGAQPISTSASSIEWVAARSSLIVHAVIEDVSIHKLRGGLHSSDGINRYQTITARVLETLRGEHSDHLQFVENGDWSHHRLVTLEKNEQQVLLFLEPWLQNRKFRRSSGGYAYTRFPLVVKDAVLFTAKGCSWAHTTVPVLSSDLKPISTTSEAINAVSAYLKSRSDEDPLRSVTALLPPDLRGGFHQVRFTAPVDAIKEKNELFVASRKSPVISFEEFNTRFGKVPPAEGKPPYLRNRNSYIGVSALNLMAVDCDVIVRGVIEESCFVKRVDDPTGDEYGARIRVAETIKGTTPGQITCLISDSRDLERLRRDEQELVLFLRSNDEPGVSYPEGSLQFRTRAGLWDDSVIVLKEAFAEVLFADLTWHRDPAKILNRLREISSSTPRSKDRETPPSTPVSTELPVFDVHPPSSTVVGSSIAGNPYAIVYLPVNQELENNAREWATAENADRRWLAARAMIYFKSDKNAAILRRLLNDPAIWGRREMLRMTGLSHPHFPEFLVRWEAWHVLAGWGFEVPEPAFTMRR